MGDRDSSMNWSVLRGVFFVLSVFCCDLSFSQTLPSEWSTRIKEEAPKAWASYLNAWNNTSVEFIEKAMEGDKVLTNTEGLLIFSYPNVSCQTTNNLKSQTSVVVSNRRYDFSLIKETVSSWSIKSLEKREGTIAENNLNFPLLSGDNPPAISESLVARNFARGFMISLADWFPNIFVQPEFRILDIRSTTEDGKLLVHLKYEYTPKSRRNQLVQGGEIVLLPDYYWLVKQTSVELIDPDGTKLHGSITCDYDYSNAVPRLLCHTLKINELNQTLLRSFSNYRVIEKIPDKEFTLSHYGLPEPDFGERSVGWLRYILMTIGGLLIIYALLRMYRERKEKQQ